VVVVVVVMEVVVFELLLVFEFARRGCSATSLANLGSRATIMVDHTLVFQGHLSRLVP